MGAARGRRVVEGRSDEVPGDIEHARVKVAELLEQRRAHVCARDREIRDDRARVNEKVVRTDVVRTAARA